MSELTLPDFINEYEALTSYDHYPTLRELLRMGGQPGLEYLGVHGSNLRLFARYGWKRVPQLEEFGITGPKGTADTVVLMYRGKPIPGAAQGNGKRILNYDIALEPLTGLPIDGIYTVPLPKVTDAEMANASNQRPPKEPPKESARA